jgi:hypothetical protein
MPSRPGNYLKEDDFGEDELDDTDEKPLRSMNLQQTKGA